MALSPHINMMLRAAEKAGRSLVRDFGEVEQLQVSRKGPGDFVSSADRRAEEIIFEELSKAGSGYSFLMEERGAVDGGDDAQYRWIVDPLDGTNNFLHGVPHWCISIGLEENGEVIAGVIFDPVKDETFRAEKGNGAFMRNKRLRVSGRTQLDQAMIATGMPGRDHKGQKAVQFMAEYRAVQSVAPGLRRMGAAALDMAYVAAGRYEGFWERGVNAWDVAAGLIIVKEAGGMVSGLQGDPLHGGGVLVANPTIFTELDKVLKAVKV